MKVRHTDNTKFPYSIDCDHGELVAIATAVERACEEDLLSPDVLIPLQAALHRVVAPTNATSPTIGALAECSPVVIGPGPGYRHAVNCELIGGDPLEAVAEAAIGR